MNNKLIRLTESDLHRIVKESATNIIKEVWNKDRFEYDHLSDEGNNSKDKDILSSAKTWQFQTRIIFNGNTAHNFLNK